MVYGIHKGGRVGVVYCASVVHWYCNRVSNADGGGNKGMLTSARKLRSDRISCTGQSVPRQARRGVGSVLQSTEAR